MFAQQWHDIPALIALPDQVLATMGGRRHQEKPKFTMLHH